MLSTERIDKVQVAAGNFTEWWQLSCNNGRQVWEFTPPAAYCNLDFSKAEGAEVLEAMSKQFAFNKAINPNSTDAVFRATANNTSAHKATTLTGALDNGWKYFTALQSDDGHWAGDYGGPMFLLPGLVIVAYITQAEIPAPHKKLMARYMLNHQNTDGGWGLHLEGKSTMFGTCLQYVSLRLLGESTSTDAMKNALVWIHKHGGATGIPPWGKFYLSCLGVYEWEGCNSLLPELWLLPKGLPIHPSRYWCHARMVYLPMSYCYGVKLTAKQTALTAALRKELYVRDYADIDWKAARNTCAEPDIYHPAHPLLNGLNLLTNTYEVVKVESLRKRALDFVYSYIQTEDIQTNYIDIGPVNKVMNMLCVWHKEGSNSPAMQLHKQRLFDYLWLAEDGMKMQGYNGSQFWDAAFTMLAMKEGGMENLFDDAYQKGLTFIRNQQITEEPFKWDVFFRHKSVGGFPFSTKQHGWPITDCTAEGIKILLGEIEDAKQPVSKNITDAIELILSFQNKDGGWASYENSRAPKWIEVLNPSLIFGNIMIDYSYTECSSASIQALIKFHKKYPLYKPLVIKTAIQKGINFILRQQQPDGSWYGSWAVCFTYGTWFAVEALVAAKQLSIGLNTVIDNALKKAEQFLLAKQMSDGGWGEDFESSVQKRYIQTPQSQTVNTSWALMTLMLFSDNKAVIELGINRLIEKQLPNGDWKQEQVNGVFNHNCMISYTNYRNIFPLWALGRWRHYSIKY